MKTTSLIIATLFTILVATQAAPVEESSDVADLLRKLVQPEKLVMKQDLAAELDDDDDFVAKVMSNALLSSLLESDEGGENLMAAIMNSGEQEATAQFRFIRRLWDRFRNSRAGKFVGQHLRNRFCTSGK